MTALLCIDNLYKQYKGSKFFLSSGFRNSVGPINFTLEQGKILTIIGENGSGKSTLVQMIAGVIPSTSGEIYIKGHALTTMSRQNRCKSVRMIFQDPKISLNPKVTIGKILSAPLELNTDLTAVQRKQQIIATLELVGLLPDYLQFYPNMLSAVQQHQVAIARAMVLNPDVVIADSILSTLDISLGFKIVNILLEIQEKKGVSFIFISHHMNLVRHISDQVIVMQQGKIVENNTTDNIFNSPQKMSTKNLLKSQQPDYRK
ncbi:ABC transporter ATP-binding protein predicted for antimicrobial peptide [Psychromonas ingrahamii 37]|uniref:ABC transporter ATP-binding protein predicted for antimicrobial peptide n=1 Tax=Psychromonas ingrahamii (strain DSM 17664 / CCUG 51855 / 37) TaxID=357804 RepID=A1SWS2_PSYIN|nr:ABC transporter ATP-binding protein [Psychromonas ingrahamii]ABM03937.1 ABC transporter ATP-binding protein predicted for antimicrobial peptide [Psychromonas ingrahamii 37]